MLSFLFGRRLTVWDLGILLGLFVHAQKGNIGFMLLIVVVWRLIGVIGEGLVAARDKAK